MLFVNLLGEIGVGEVERKNPGKKGITRFSNTIESMSENAELYVDDGCLFIKEIEGGICHDGIDIGGLVGCNTEPELLKDTEDNPLIWLLTDSVSFFNRSHVDGKFITINDDMYLFCLVKGACVVDMDGEEVALKRCLSSSADGDTYAVSPMDMVGMASYYDKETGYNMVWDSVNTISFVMRGGISCKTMREQSPLFTTENLEAAKEKLRLEKEKKEKEIAERKAKFAAAKAEAERLRAKKEDEMLEEQGYVPLKESEGAAKFRAFIERMK